MSDNVRLTLDTNVLFYARDRDSTEKYEHALRVIDRARQGDCVLTLQVLGELYNSALKRKLVPLAELQHTIALYQRLFPIIAAVPEDLNVALQVQREHGLQFWDAMLWATARRAGCKLLLSEDFQDGRELGGVRFVNPFRLTTQELKVLMG